MLMMMVLMMMVCGSGTIVVVHAFMPMPDSNAGSSFEALFVFGDSLLDPGNRRELKPNPNGPTSPLIDADHPPYGRDFPTHTPTGRFSDGLVCSDILASFMGLPYPPAYLKNKNDIMKGCSFATSGAKILNNTASQFPRLNFVDQVRLFADVHQQMVLEIGEVEASRIISRSLFLTCLGSNDYISDYVVQKIRTPLENFRQTLISSYAEYLQILYSLGARKFGVVSLPPLGCLPTLQFLAEHDCVSFIDQEVKSFNGALLQMSIQLQETYLDAHFISLNSFDISLDAVTHPTKYGFLYGLQPCCANNGARAVPLCMEGISSICNNASEHVFWDFAHPTQAMSFLIARNYWEGSSPDVYPINLQELARL